MEKTSVIRSKWLEIFDGNPVMTFKALHLRLIAIYQAKGLPHDDNTQNLISIIGKAERHGIIKLNEKKEYELCL